MYISAAFNRFRCLVYNKMRRRVYKGTLVGSTNRFRAIKAKRLVVEVLYSFRRGIVMERTVDVRNRIEQ